MTGQVEGFASLSLLTDSIGEAVAGADLVGVPVPTASLPTYASALAETISEDQIILLNPGHSGGALYLATEFERAGHREACAGSASSPLPPT